MKCIGEWFGKRYEMYWGMIVKGNNFKKKVKCMGDQGMVVKGNDSEKKSEMYRGMIQKKV